MAMCDPGNYPIPIEISSLIFSYILDEHDVKTACTLRRVSKRWRFIISQQPFFIDSGINHEEAQMLFKIFPMTHGLKFFTEDMPMLSSSLSVLGLFANLTHLFLLLQPIPNFSYDLQHLPPQLTNLRIASEYQSEPSEPVSVRLPSMLWHLKELRLSTCDVTMPVLPALTQLGLRDVSTNTIKNGNVSSLTDLKALHLSVPPHMLSSSSPLFTSLVALLPRLSNLESLSFLSSVIPPNNDPQWRQELLNIVPQLTKLKNFNAECLFDSLDPSLLHVLWPCTQLTSLHVFQSRDYPVEIIQQLTQLSQLALHLPNIESFTFPFLRPSHSSFPEVQCAIMSFWGLKTWSNLVPMIRPENCPLLSQLTRLETANFSMQPGSGLILSALVHGCKNSLRTLSFENMGPDLVTFELLLQFSRLHSLRLCSSLMFTNEHFKILSESDSLAHSLTSLDLLNLKSLQSIAPISRLTRLISLGLIGIHFPESDYVHVGHLPQLRALRSHARITASLSLMLAPLKEKLTSFEFDVRSVVAAAQIDILVSFKAVYALSIGFRWQEELFRRLISKSQYTKLEYSYAELDDIEALCEIMKGGISPLCKTLRELSFWYLTLPVGLLDKLLDSMPLLRKLSFFQVSTTQYMLEKGLAVVSSKKRYSKKVNITVEDTEVIVH